MWARRSLQVLPRAWTYGVARPVVYKQSYATFCTAKEDLGAVFRKKLQADLVTAMKSGDSAKLAAVRLIKSKITYKDKESGEADADGINQVLFNMLNTATETELEMKSHNRDDLAQKERVLIDIINAYLPKQLTRDEVKVEAEAVIKSVGATSIKDMGKVVEALSKALKGRTQPKVIGDVAKELLVKK